MIKNQYSTASFWPVAKRCLLSLGLLMFVQLHLFAQKPVQVPQDTLTKSDTTGSKYIHIRYADELNYLATGVDTLQKLLGNVELNQDTVFLFCDSATIYNGTDMVAQGNFVMQQGDSTTIFADSAEYSGNTKVADLYSNVSMLKGRQKLFTEQLTYDANTKIATYLTGATLTDDTTFLKSTRGYFHSKTDDIFFRDSVVVVNPDFTLKSDTLQFNARTKIVTFLAPTLLIQDTAKIYTEAGTYNINKKYAEFTVNPQYVKNDQKAWALRMTYNGKDEVITLMGDAHFEDSVSVASADIIRHNKRTGVTILEGNAFFKDADRTLTGDTISYDAKNETYSTRGRSHIVDGEQILDADQIDYVKEREVGIATGNVIFVDTLEKMTVICEYAEHSKKRNYLKAYGGRDSLGNLLRPLLIQEIDGDSLFISADTLVSFVPSADTIDTNQTVSSQDSIIGIPPMDTSLTDRLAIIDSLGIPPGPDSIITLTAGLRTPKPLDTIPGEIQKELDKGSAEISTILESTASGALAKSNAPEQIIPDSLMSITAQDSTNLQPEKEPEEERVILAYKDVRIYKSDLQAVCDSLSYSSSDSLFRLFDDPIIWSDTSQFTADHIKIQMKNNSIDRIFMEENSFIVNTPDEVFFNQIKGRNSVAYFLPTGVTGDSTELKYVKVVGNAESVYYAQDDAEAYIGVNKTVCSEMKILFGSNQVEGIVFYAQPTANLFPMKEADHNELQMPGFSWQVERRPNNVEDLTKQSNKADRATAVPAKTIEEASFEKVQEIVPKREK